VTQYRSKEGDTVDYVAWKHYGRQDGRVVEQVLEANPGLADLGPVLPAGTLVNLPEIASTPTTATATTGVKLWD
jgi:phage tail protein X